MRLIPVYTRTAQLIDNIVRARNRIDQWNAWRARNAPTPPPNADAVPTPWTEADVVSLAIAEYVLQHNFRFPDYRIEY